MSPCDRPGRWVRGLVILVAGVVPAVPAKAAEKLKYNRDVRPILAENCFACHGPDSAARKADLRLDQRDLAIASGTLVPGKPDSSPTIERIFSDDPSELMPPPKSHKKLTKAQKDTLRRWVLEGAEYEPHWAFVPPKRPAVPVVKDKAWVRNPVDAFILADLERAGLKPAPEADRRTLARRLSLDLTGLPPNPADVDAFVTDKSPDYYEKFVAKLMAAPAWGEHRGRYWLDAARYADTHGIHFDNFREMYSYRDWVIEAFNRNLPFDQFTIEQLAGDLLPEPTVDQLVATGFNRCNITTNEGGAISEEYLVLYTRDRTETVNQVWMGLTAGCAVCHDHKFDPISQKDFYGMAAFFNNTTQNAMDGNIHNTPPVITVPRAEDRQRFEALTGELKAAKAKVEARKKEARGEFTKWLKGVDPATLADQIPTAGLVFHAPLTEGKGKESAAFLNGKDFALKFPGPSGTSGRRTRSACPPGSATASGTRPGPSSPGWTRPTGTAAGTSGCKTTGSGRTSSRSGRTTRSRSWPRTR
jgi:cytochrome c553